MSNKSVEINWSNLRKAFICPTKYMQGEDELLNLRYFVKGFGTSALLIAHPDDVNSAGGYLQPLVP